MYVGLAFGMFWIAWLFFGLVVNTVSCWKLFRRLREDVERHYGTDRPTRQRELPPDCTVEVKGDYLFAWVWKNSRHIWGEGWKVGKITLNIRLLTAFWRLGTWLYLLIETEAIVRENNLSAENI